MSKAFEEINAGLEDAIKHAKGKKTKVVVHQPEPIDVRAIRENTGMSQQRFCATFGISLLFAELCSMMNKTVAMVEPLKAVLQPFLMHIELAFVYGSVAKKSDTASSDIDLMIISDSLTYADVFPALEEVADKLQRNIQPTIYSLEELTKRIQSDNSFIKRVLNQPKVWIIGKDSELPAG